MAEEIARTIESLVVLESKNLEQRERVANWPFIPSNTFCLYKYNNINQIYLEKYINTRQFGVTFPLLGERKASYTLAKYNNSSKEELEGW